MPNTTTVGIQLQDPRLFRQACYVDGGWIESSAHGIDVDNPATGEVIGTVPRLGRAETRQAIDAAARAFPAWRRETGQERAQGMRRRVDLMMADPEDLAPVAAAETG